MKFYSYLKLISIEAKKLYFFYSRAPIWATICLFISTPIYANFCNEYFSNPLLLYPTSKEMELSEEVKKNLFENTKVSTFTKKHRRGQRLVFRFSSHQLGPISTLSTGEVIQTAFLQKLIAYILPEAKFETINQSQHPKYLQRVDVRVQDPWRYGSFLSEDAFPISYLKVSNSSSSFLTERKEILRRSFNFDSGFKFIHLYGLYPFDSHVLLNQEFIPLINELENIVPKSKIIISTGTIPTNKIKNYLQNYNIQTLTEYFLYPKENTDLIINNTLGYLPYIHAASDVVIIQGPLNIFEPLHVGTPVVIYNNHSTLQQYDREGYSEMIETALQTQGAFHVSQKSELADNLKLAFELNQSILPPHRVPITKQTTEFDYFLDFLLSYLDSRIESFAN